jgi:LmbE family N-acetylglucosaminyl deacetylase
LRKYIWMVLGSALLIHLPVKAQQRGIPNAGELEIALHKLNVLGSVLYVGAHPDDENTSLLAYLSKGRKYRTAYLSITRGEGGQNLIGPEQGSEIGMIRTHELLAARRIDGAEQYFTRAVDFGYSKTAEESLEFWGPEKVLGDIVGVIRRYRPDVIISRFSDGSSGGHGHHAAAGRLIKEAFTAASDPNRFPEQLKVWPAWRAKRFLWNSGRPGPGEVDSLLRIDTGEYNPLLGKSYTEMGGESRSQHKSQGFGSAGRRGTQYDYFVPALGDPAGKDLFDGIDVSWNRIPGGQKTGLLLAECLSAFDPRQPAKSVSGLLGVYSELSKLEESDWVLLKKEELARVIQACAGIWMEAIANDFAAAPGDEIQIKTSIVNRSDLPFSLQRLGYPEFASIPRRRGRAHWLAPPRQPGPRALPGDRLPPYSSVMTSHGRAAS